MKTLVSLALALTAIPVAAAIAAPAAPPPPAELVAGAVPGGLPALDESALRARITNLDARARSAAVRLGLTAAPDAPVPTGVAALAAAERRLSWIVAFLDRRSEVALAVDERPAVPARTRGVRSARLAREYATVARLTRRLGLDTPAAPQLARDPADRPAQIGRWTAVARWLANRSELIRPDERPLSRKIPHYAELMCIAGHESNGTWDIATGNGYYGGLQMDRLFASTYGPRQYAAKGTADHWTPEEQMRAAERAIVSRGFTPWPNTARMCGLL